MIHATRLLAENLVKQLLAEALKLESQTVEQLLTVWVDSTSKPAQKAITEFLDPAFTESNTGVDITVEAFPDGFKTFARLHKVASVFLKFRVTPDQSAWLFGYGFAVGWLDLNQLPLEPSSSEPTLFNKWMRLVDLFRLRDQLPLGDRMLAEIFSLAEGSTQEEVLDRLSKRTGWRREDLDYLVDTDGFAFSFPDAFKSEQALLRLKDSFAILKRLGVSAQECVAWSKSDPTDEEARVVARSIKQAAKAKYDQDEWLTVAKPLRDEMREKQRAALVAYLGARPHIIRPVLKSGSSRFVVHELKEKLNASGASLNADSSQFDSDAKTAVEDFQTAHSLPVNGVVGPWTWAALDNGREFFDSKRLYQHFLMDVEMDPCALTSRTKQAISAVQLFVQRCRMNLEPDVHIHEDESKQWEWMKNYRVWEANRKVFLYPENWIEPALRDSKSPFFKELENELLQNELTTDRAETAFRNYLYKLDEVAHLEVCGIYHELEFHPRLSDPHEPLVDVQHVFGRTEGNPRTYYYRRRINTTWTPWDKVDLDIQGNHPIPVVWNRRLHLFWPVFEEKEVDEPLPKKNDEGEKPKKRWDIRLAWSEYRDGGWSARKVSNEFIATHQQKATKRSLSYTPPKNHFSFRAFVGVDLVIRCYVLDGSLTRMRSLAEFHLSSCRWHVGVNDHEGDLLHAWTTLKPRWMTFVDPTGAGYALDMPVGGAHIRAVLNTTPSTYKLLPPDQEPAFWSFETPFFYFDDSRTFFVQPIVPPPAFSWGASSPDDPLDWLPPDDVASDEPADYEYSPPDAPSDEHSILPPTTWETERMYLFETFYHPYVCEFLKLLNRQGIEGLLRRNNQLDLVDEVFFEDEYKPNKMPRSVEMPYPIEDVDFDADGAYALYNWELFFHIPLLIADRLSQNQRFEEAQKWFHYIFDPTDRSGYDTPGRFWQVRPFFENSDAKKSIAKLLKLLNECDEKLEKQVEEWRKNPFNPHLIARLRLNAYQKSVVMKYIDNLIAWGDQLFRQDTIESINEATQLYVLAAEILGRRPETVPSRTADPVLTYDQVEPYLDDFSNVLLEVENLVAKCGDNGGASDPNDPPLPMLETLYFCIPKNEKLLSYWDTVADRLFKIRHCMTIEGVVRQLPLFQPPIDPGLLVKAVAVGVDISSVLNDMNAAAPRYRFSLMIQKASELCADLRALGSALLSALEKRDAEALSILRSSHESKVLGAVRLIKDQQITEANDTREGLKKARDLTVIRQDYYKNLEFMNAFEQAQLNLIIAGAVAQLVSQAMDVGAAAAHHFPDSYAGFAGGYGSPLKFWHTVGGSKEGSALQAVSRAMGILATIANTTATLSSIMGGYVRRDEEWDLQEELAAKEEEQFDAQIAAADVRVAIAGQDLDNHDLQIENAKAADEFLRTKFTNRELYDWMVSQISSIYFQSYQLAYDVAKRAEQAYRFELGLTDSNFIQFGYWDSLKKGLLAGEKLHHDLKRMEMAYLEQNKREYEITKHVSLAMADPVALARLKETGQCFLRLPEALFDLDFPGQYMRRIKSVSVTIPCVTGPYTGVNCTLTLLKSSVRQGNALLEGEYRRREEGDDPRFVDSRGAVQSIVTSGGQNDSGMFEPNLRDERYLPFEGTGAISQWRIELPVEFKPFDYDTITDVVLHLRYSAREGGELLKRQALQELTGVINEIPLGGSRRGLFRLFSARHEFSNEWYRFLSSPAPDQKLKISLDADRFPFEFQTKKIKIQTMHSLLKLKEGMAYGESLPFGVDVNKEGSPGSAEIEFELQKGPIRHMPYATAFEGPDQEPGQWNITVNLPGTSTNTGVFPPVPVPTYPDALEDLWIIVRYSVGA